MRLRAALALLVAFGACPPPPPEPPPPEDAGAVEEVVYDGPTQSSGIPTLPDDFAFDASIPLIDSGVIDVDRTCCSTNFSISDQEPSAGVTGTLRIELVAFSQGIALTRGGGRWTASACFPVNLSAPYVYEFVHDAGFVDGGWVELDDGGVANIEFVDIRVTRRASDEEPSFELADGSRANFFRDVANCAGLDGSVPP